MAYGAHYLQGAIDVHVHACPHINGRSATVFEAVRQAAAAGMRAIGLMDNFQNSSGYAALAMAELGDLGVEVFGGLIMQPSAGGVSLEAARSALAYGYETGRGARFISLPTHHVRAVAEREGRGADYLATTFHVPDRGPIPEPVPAIMALCAEADAVFDCGHVSAPEAVRLVEAAKALGCARLRMHCTGYAADAVAELAALGAWCEFSFFSLTHATQVGLTHVDREAHRAPGKTVADILPGLRAAGDRAILSSDAGIFLLSPPAEALREFLVLLEAAGVAPAALRRMVTDAPAALFGIAPAAA